MTKSAKIKLEIIKRLEVLSMTKLKRVYEYMVKLEGDKDRRKRILASAGSWEDIDQEVFDDLTIHLKDNRTSDKRSF